MKEFLLDANVLIRLLVQDDLKQSAAAAALFIKAERHELILHLDVLTVAETVYVMTGMYRQERNAVVNALLSIIQTVGIKTADREMVTDALHRFGTLNVDFPDAWLAARAAQFDYKSGIL
jgi:predicted nucleic-acid-binding protein